MVAERIKDLFLSSCGDDIAVCPIILRKIGRREANLPTPMPSTGEPEDIINEVPFVKRHGRSRALFPDNSAQ